MALKKDTIIKIAQALKLNPSEFEAIVKDSEEKDVAIPELTVFEKAEIEARDKNKKDEGIKVGKDLQIKDLKEKAGLTYSDTGSLDPERFIKEYSKKLETDLKIEPEKKVQALNEQITLLQNKNKEYETNIASIQKEAKEARFNAELLGELPANRSKIISDNEYLTLIRANLDFADEGIKKGGEILRDPKTQSPLDRKTAINNFFSERKWIEESGGAVGGRGAGDGKAAHKPAKLTEAISDWEKQGKNIATVEFQDYVKGLKVENKEFDLNA